MSLATAMQARAPAMMARLGEPATYYTDTTNAPVTAVIRRDLERYPDLTGQIAENRVIIDLLKDEVGDPERGERVVTTAKSYRIDSILEDTSAIVSVLALEEANP